MNMKIFAVALLLFFLQIPLVFGMEKRGSNTNNIPPQNSGVSANDIDILRIKMKKISVLDENWVIQTEKSEYLLGKDVPVIIEGKEKDRSSLKKFIGDDIQIAIDKKEYNVIIEVTYPPQIFKP